MARQSLSTVNIMGHMGCMSISTPRLCGFNFAGFCTGFCERV